LSSHRAADGGAWCRCGLLFLGIVLAWGWLASCAGSPGDGDTAGDLTDAPLDSDAADVDAADADPPDGDADVTDAETDRDAADPDTVDVETADTRDEAEPDVVDATDVGPDPDVPLSDWVPDGEWTTGICPPGTLPEHSRPEGLTSEETAARAVAGDAMCVCVPGLCVEIPSGAFSHEVELGVFAQPRLRYPMFAVSPGLFVSVWETGVLDRAVPDPARPWRFAVRGFPPDVLEGDSADTRAYVRFSPYSRPPDAGDFVAGGGWVTEDVWAFEWTPEGEAGLMLYLAYPGDLCGNGVVDEGEYCDRGTMSSLESACHGCWANENVRCEGEPSLCVLHCEDVTCADPGPCAESRCDRRFGGCVVWPDEEGETCTLEGGGSGWCEAGACVAEARQCVACGDGGRLVDGECWPADIGLTWEPGAPGFRDFSGGGSENGARHATPVAGTFEGWAWGDLTSGIEPRGFEPDWLEIQYRVRPWENVDPDRSDEVDVRFANVPLPPDVADWHVERVSVSDRAVARYWSEVYADNGSDVLTGGAVDIRRFRLSAQGAGVCEMAVEVDGEWDTCPVRVGYDWCGDACVDLTSNETHCGTCDNPCSDREACIGGTCVCEPALTQFAPEHCDGCEPGMWGFDCDQKCPGVEETGEACSGHGWCHDGPLGTGRCMCDEWPTVSHEARRHGMYCQYACNDGVRNGNEQSIDCGGPCRQCEGF
jgi:hypothetical protein